LQLTGRDPVRMIHGLVSNDVAGAPEGQGVYAAMLTPKGKMVADLRIFRLPDRVLLEMAASAEAAVREHLKKFVPPLFARVETTPEALRVVGVYGPRARELLGAALGSPPEAGAPEEAFTTISTAHGEALVIRTAYAGDGGYDVVVPAADADTIWRTLHAAGAVPAGHAALEALRIEAGRPRWGADLDDTVIPIEAGLRERAISETKGCYTGQEVIIRILHRGHVNRHLRGLLLGDAPLPAPGTPLTRAADARPVGQVTSACASPGLGQTIALGYVRREIEPPAELRLGSPEGAVVRVVALPFELAAG
ncbi:MAG TPA: glycine cleavage T C-terminal barrel domain-containing protein, partial [Longimicrobiales bacterium]|nr:glycine cleavage T C-terminal barrel domain-containing protein [Longimicrobiales bacterium]